MGQPNKMGEKKPTNHEKLKYTQIMKTKNKGREKQWSVAQDRILLANLPQEIQQRLMPIAHPAPHGQNLEPLKQLLYKNHSPQYIQHRVVNNHLKKHNLL